MPPTRNNTNGQVDGNTGVDMQQAIDERNILLAAIVSSAEDAIIGSDLNGHVISWNHAAHLLFGYTAKEITGQAFSSLFPKEQLPEHRALIKLLQHNNTIGQLETVGRRQDGSEVPVSLTISAIRNNTRTMTDDDGQSRDITGFSLIVRDFSVGYRLAERLTLSERHFRQVVEATPNAMIIVGCNGLIEMINTQAEKSFGYNRKELLGQAIELLVPERIRQQHPELRDSYIANPVPRNLNQGNDLFAQRKDGSEFPVQISLNPIQTADGLKILAAIIDTSERKRFTDELSRRNEELDNFAYVASHDLKSPLRNLSQLASWISEDLAGKMNEETTEHLRLMQTRIKRMEKLLDDLLLYFRADQLGGTVEQVDFATMVRDVFELCCPDKSFELELLGHFPCTRTHKVALELVLRNLINNAIKHHDKHRGRITVRVVTKEKQFEIAVCDDGPGISEEHRERVFAMFQTLRPRDEVEGSGMGLAILRKTIESLGGKISLGDNLPHGAVFTFTWPRHEENDTGGL